MWLQEVNSAVLRNMYDKSMRGPVKFLLRHSRLISDNHDAVIIIARNYGKRIYAHDNTTFVHKTRIISILEKGRAIMELQHLKLILYAIMMSPI